MKYLVLPLDIDEETISKAIEKSFVLTPSDGSGEVKKEILKKAIEEIDKVIDPPKPDHSKRKYYSPMENKYYFFH